MNAQHHTISPDDLRAIRRSRRHPAITQLDYLHLRALVAGLRESIRARFPARSRTCSTSGAARDRTTTCFRRARAASGLDVEGNPYGVADVVSNELLPFPDESFDLVTCIQAFHYIADPARRRRGVLTRPPPGRQRARLVGVRLRVRPTAHFEARYTEHELRALFAGWDDVRVREDGGRTVTWTVLTGSLLHGLEQRVRRQAAGRLLRPVFLASYALVNAAGRALGRAEPATRAHASLPMNLTLTARKPLRA